jgi:hypothetical protein
LVKIVKFAQNKSLDYIGTMERNNKWLQSRLEIIWQRYFPDVAVANNVFVKFGRPSMTRLGSIKPGQIKENTVITINGYPEIPEFVVDAVLAHELTHYAHGFFSPHEQKHRLPHKGGVVRNEMIDRGLQELLRAEKKWIKINWREYIRKKHI